MNRLLTLACLMMLAFTGCVDIVDIPDANLRDRTTQRLGKASNEEITAAELATLTSFIASNKGIRDLTGLEYATNLTDLYLSDNNISDVSALSNLTNLTSLGLYANNISDVSALSNLTNLTDLSLSKNSISDVSALSNLTNLTDLNLTANNISDLAPLVANTGLGAGDSVSLLNNPLSATSIITHIPALQNRRVRVTFSR